MIGYLSPSPIIQPCCRMGTGEIAQHGCLDGRLPRHRVMRAFPGIGLRCVPVGAGFRTDTGRLVIRTDSRQFRAGYHDRGPEGALPRVIVRMRRYAASHSARGDASLASVAVADAAHDQVGSSDPMIVGFRSTMRGAKCSVSTGPRMAVTSTSTRTTLSMRSSSRPFAPSVS
jgi:hypothetical protein